MVYDTESLGLCEALAGYCVLGLLGRFCGAHAMEPILDPNQNIIGKVSESIRPFAYLDL